MSRFPRIEQRLRGYQASQVEAAQRLMAPGRTLEEFIFAIEAAGDILAPSTVEALKELDPDDEVTEALSRRAIRNYKTKSENELNAVLQKMDSLSEVVIPREFYLSVRWMNDFEGRFPKAQVFVHGECVGERYINMNGMNDGYLEVFAINSALRDCPFIQALCLRFSERGRTSPGIFDVDEMQLPEFNGGLTLNQTIETLSDLGYSAERVVFTLGSYVYKFSTTLTRLTERTGYCDFRHD